MLQYNCIKEKEDTKMSVKVINKNNFEELKNGEKPLLIDFFAAWCGPCRMLAPIIEEVAEEREDVVVGKVNVDEEPELAASFGVVSIPTLVVLKDGKIFNKAMGAMPLDDILDLLP